MPDSNLTVRIDAELKEAFAQAARRRDRTTGQVLRELMRDYVQHAREDDEYEAWFRRKVKVGMSDLRAGRVLSNEEGRSALCRPPRR